MSARLLSPDEPPAFTARNLGGASPLVLLCEHASNRLPRRLGDLGLPSEELRRHIAWDIGAAALAGALSRALDAPLFETGYSRLVIDCNRPLGVSASIPERSEDTAIPGNLALSAEDRRAREEALFHPFQNAVAAHLDARQAAGRPTAIIGVHSFTPIFRGIRRPWEAGVLFDGAKDFAMPLIEGLSASGLAVGENEPYRIEVGDDYTVPVHGDGRGLPALLIEIRQNLLADDAAARHWADRLVSPIRRALAAALPAKEPA
ncbi:N-formylglutamate amidohydrolase [Pararoseomonas indoligenes]|uniref:N-formylglutamate amidohydrolase n=1 Tax=Roseomonas indoligenes TaxID=2820811 RepID=A0A940N372_9PROT|nr:N-formylglutamate amidohydrolase [Pararoseomonas indoligenes]MBP0495930.1 N-formylglutamate amidohydrolase [Pararoseomonas indoligenes]